MGVKIQVNGVTVPVSVNTAVVILKAANLSVKTEITQNGDIIIINIVTAKK